MIDWRDEGVILCLRQHGESAAIVEIFTRAHGRHAGVVRGGGGRRLAPLLQPGNQVQAEWHARLAEHLGVFTVEPLRSRVLAGRGEAMEVAEAQAKLAEVTAQLQALERLRKNLKH